MRTAWVTSVPEAAGRRAALGLLWLYRYGISGLKPPCCRFHPTCSAYAYEAVSRLGLFRGGWLALRRLCRCHPFYSGPLFDPVPGTAEGFRCQVSGVRKEHSDAESVAHP